uniref:Large subunit GTPase 1 homolog n=2 Tax=Parascaris univalens TaxID=6257 RepID=A0A915BVA9_PARUN
MTKRRPSNKKPVGVNRSLGNSLLNDRERVRLEHRAGKAADLDHRNAAFVDYAKQTPKNIDSVTDETSLEEFLANAQLAGTEFIADHCDVRILKDTSTYVVPTKKDIRSSQELQKAYQHRLLIPRRPKQGLWQTPNELIALENENFLEWRKGLADLQEVDGLVLTPFERNLELWRQLWRVIERSDIVVQIVDARNPLLFRSTDLEAYVKECDAAKQNVLLVNKADLLTDEQIELWRRWFEENNINAIFWYAVELELENMKENTKEEEFSGSEDSGDSTVDEGSENIRDEKNEELCRGAREERKQERVPFLRSPDELIEYLKGIGHTSALDAGNKPLVVGMVGYPNVGKSSTINRILGKKKVSVSVTPGKTRHLQTLIVDDEVTLCDCPGLVMPSFAFSRSEMLLNGVLPVDNMREHFAPIALLASRIPRRYFETTYSVMLPKPAEHEHPESPPTAHQLLTSVAFIRGFMAASGIPDCSRAARLIIKDVVNGRLKWIAAPPGIEQEAFDKLTYPHSGTAECEASRYKGAVFLQQLEKRHLIESSSASDKSLDKEFFMVSQGSAHIRPVKGMPGMHGDKNEGTTRDNMVASLNSLGIKASKKHHNKSKKEKLRRVYADLTV